MAARSLSPNQHVFMIKWGSLWQEGTPEIPARKEVMPLMTTPSLGGFHAVYLLPFRADFESFSILQAIYILDT